jgi:uncharacterized protein YjbI with pentapeptide repeats
MVTRPLHENFAGHRERSSGVQRFKEVFTAVLGCALVLVVAFLFVSTGVLSWKWGAGFVVAVVFVVALSFFRVSWAGFGEHDVRKTVTEEVPPEGGAPRLKSVAYETQTYRTLWDWIGLLTISAVLALVAFRYTTQQNEQQQALQEQQAKDANLRAYIDGMSTLMLEEGLLISKEGHAVREVAQARTLVALISVGSENKRQVVRFLYESRLITGPNPIVDLSEANLEDADLTGSYLEGINLSGANLSDGADPKSRGALLIDAELQGAYLAGADLSRANLNGANGITEAELREQAATLDGVTMPDGSTFQYSSRRASLSGPINRQHSPHESPQPFTMSPDTHFNQPDELVSMNQLLVYRYLSKPSTLRTTLQARSSRPSPSAPGNLGSWARDPNFLWSGSR